MLRDDTQPFPTRPYCPPHWWGGPQRPCTTAAAVGAVPADYLAPPLPTFSPDIRVLLPPA